MIDGLGLTIKDFLSYIYFIISGILIGTLSLFFASGTIAENPEGVQFSEPIYLWNILIWAIGIVLYFMKLKLLGLIIITIPVLYFVILFLFPGTF